MQHAQYQHMHPTTSDQVMQHLQLLATVVYTAAAAVATYTAAAATATLLQLQLLRTLLQLLLLQLLPPH